MTNILLQTSVKFIFFCCYYFLFLGLHFDSSYGLQFPWESLHLVNYFLDYIDHNNPKVPVRYVQYLFEKL